MKNVHRLALALLAFAGSVEARPYVVVPGMSTVTFTGTYEGESFDGRFAKFSATVSVDPANPAKTAIAAEIDVASVDTQNAERDETLATPDFFDAARFPKAMFATTACRGKAPAYTCDASLTIRDRTKAIVFPFKWTERADGSATLVAKVPLQRLAFDVGRGDWADTGLIADDVSVRVSLALTPRK